MHRFAAKVAFDDLRILEAWNSAFTSMAHEHGFYPLSFCLYPLIVRCEDGLGICALVLPLRTAVMGRLFENYFPPAKVFCKSSKAFFLTSSGF